MIINTNKENMKILIKTIINKVKKGMIIIKMNMTQAERIDTLAEKRAVIVKIREINPQRIIKKIENKNEGNF